MFGGNKRVAKIPLENVVDLLFYFFKFVFHHDYKALHVGVVCFAANRVNLSSDFLRNKAKFFSLRLSAQFVTEVRTVRL